MSNFMANYTGAKLFADRPFASKNFGKASWDAALRDGYNPTQIKVALQQLGQQGYGIGSGLRTDRMQGTPGIAKNPLSKYQGPLGNFGKASYNAAKADGMTTEEIGLNIGSSGMYMPSGSMNQWVMDTQSEYNARMKSEQAQMQADMDKWKADFQAAQVPTIQRSGNPGAVGKPGQLRIETGDDLTGRRRGIKSLSRNSTYQNSLGGVSSGSSSPVNIKP